MFRLLGIVILLSLASAAPATAQSQFVAPVCYELLPSFNGAGPTPAPRRYFHLVARWCDKIAVNGQLEQIPTGVAVIGGGIVGDTLNICINKVCGQTAAPNTVYHVWVFKDCTSTCVLKTDISTGDGSGHMPSQWGYHVHKSDESRTFVGMIATNENSLLNGQAASLTIASWPPMTAGRTGIQHYFGLLYSNYYPKTCSTTLTVPDAIDANGNATSGLDKFFVEILTFGINDQFRQAWTMPNIQAQGTVRNTTAEKQVHVAIGIQKITPWTIGTPAISQGGPRSTHTESGNAAGVAYDPESAAATAVGGNGAEEGLVRGYLMMAAPNGGCAFMPEGQVFTSPHG